MGGDSWDRWDEEDSFSLQSLRSMSVVADAMLLIIASGYAGSVLLEYGLLLAGGLTMALVMWAQLPRCW